MGGAARVLGEFRYPLELIEKRMLRDNHLRYYLKRKGTTEDPISELQQMFREWQFLPTTSLLDNEHERQALLEMLPCKGHNELWLVKGVQHGGVAVTKPATSEELRAQLGGCDERCPVDTEEIAAAVGSVAEVARQLQLRRCRTKEANRDRHIPLMIQAVVPSVL